MAPWPRRTERLELREMLPEDIPRVTQIRQLPGVDEWLLNDAVDTFADNIASWRVLEKVGMRREKHAHRSVRHREPGWVDEYEYAILREEWLALRES